MFSQFFNDWREMLSEQVEYRELLYRMTARDLLLRYKQTVMGFGWAVFTPLLNTAVFSVIFMRVAQVQTPVPYPLYAYSGLWAWTFFASSLRFSTTSLTSNPNLVTKVFFPREVFPFSAIIVSFVDFLVAAIPLIALMAYYRVGPSSSIFLLPVVIIVHLSFTAAIALALAMANLFYRDVKYLFELVITLWMFLTSVLYPLELAGGKIAAFVQLNPMTPIIDGYRVALFGLPMRNPAGFVLASCLALTMLALGWRLFHRSEFQFAENI